ncbi:MAG: Asp-tRNA(Asn)/Glu-tRNA(Gln) amidotransferase subunit GatC [Betaproteobacteria bacterium]|nr:MAG: Asp-tRNA(Asn)/Glu-tRNA(Gln) amidotransferase subunit GatC [Betaproteobacteria bacterium]
MSLSHDQIRRIARLARIAIRPEESEAALERLNRVLGLIDEMRAVDTRGIEPMAHPLEAHLPGGQRLRPDEVIIYQSVAPAVEDGLYLVPKVIE